MLDASSVIVAASRRSRHYGVIFLFFFPLPRCSSWRKALPRLKAIMMQGWRCSALLTKYSNPPPPPTHPLGQVAGVSGQCGRQSFWWGVRMEQNYPSASSPHVSQMAVLSLLLLLLLLLFFPPPPTRKLCVVCWHSTCMLMESARGFVGMFFWLIPKFSI